MSIERIALCLNTEDPEQKELFEFITKLPSGKKRNASAFLKTLASREYKKKRSEYLVEKEKYEQEKETLLAPQVELIKSINGEIKYLAKDIY